MAAIAGVGSMVTAKKPSVNSANLLGLIGLWRGFFLP